MGVGVYTSDFDGKGETFIVSGPLLGEDDYAIYKKEAGEPVDFDTWIQDQNDSWVSLFEETLVGASKELGLSIVSHHRRRGYSRADFDKEFVGTSTGNMLAVGWRSWETDFVVGCGARSSAADLMDAENEFIKEETGLTKDAFHEIHTEQVSAVMEYLRLKLTEDGFECRYRTSGYTTSKYPDNPEAGARAEELKQQITQREQWLTALPQSAEPAAAPAP